MGCMMDAEGRRKGKDGVFGVCPLVHMLLVIRAMSRWLMKQLAASKSPQMWRKMNIGGVNNGRAAVGAVLKIVEV